MMLPGSLIAGVLLLSLALFFAVNLQNVMKGSARAGTEWRYIVDGDRKRLQYHLDFALGWVMILMMSLCLRA